MKSHGFVRSLTVSLVLAGVLACSVTAREIHVAKTGSDTGPGTKASPFLTITQAAIVARPGDLVTVHAGTYREWVKPARGGTLDDGHISYRAADGEEVTVKGSERIRHWVPVDGGVWKTTLPNTFFGEYNPYALNVSGGWLNYGQWHHRGDVYLNGEAFFEQQGIDEVGKTPQSWCGQVDESNTIIWAHFGAKDPNTEIAEINVRESLFMPEVTGLNYITIDGFRFQHAAANWAPPSIALQMGAIGTRMGKGWIIQNCTISDIRCVGIILGQAPEADYSDIDSFGAHLVRNNIIRRCGQAGIAGQRGATRCVIADNLIEETNYRKEFGGWETAAIKFHQSVDTLIQGNLIRGVYHQIEGAFGIWMDFGNQGTRITGNVIYNTQAAGIFLEMDHGPILVDNNILVGGGFRSNSENTVLAHNLFVDFRCDYVSDIKRRSQYYLPHTTTLAGRKTGVPQNERWYNNIFIRTGLSRVKKAPGFDVDHNVYLEGSQKSDFGDQQSVVDPLVTGFQIENQSTGATVRFRMNDAPHQITPPWVDSKLVGVFPTVEQTIEDRDGQPIRVDTDFFGHTRARPVPGPFAQLKNGPNTIVWSAK